MTDPLTNSAQLHRPRGRRLFEPLKPGLRGFAQTVAFLPVFGSGAFAAGMTQATALNYQWLFRYAILLTLVHFVLSGLYFRFVASRLRWLGLLISLLALVCLTELGLRVFFGFRLFG